MPARHIALGEFSGTAGIQEILHVFLNQISVALYDHRRITSRREVLEFGPVNPQMSGGSAELDSLALQPRLRRIEVSADPLPRIFKMQVDRILHSASIFGQED